MSIQATEVILDQVCVTFGQGTDSLAVSRTAAATLRAHYGTAVNEKVIASWGDIAAQALERVRAAGRLAAQLATARAASAIQPREVLQAAHVVTKMSDTPACPKNPPDPEDPKDGGMVPAANDMGPVMNQVLVAFGQGTGPIRISRAGVAVLRDRYGYRTDVLATWDAMAPQILERMRTMGRMAARLATTHGATVISADDVRTAAVAVEQTSATPVCPPPQGLREEREAACEREEVLVGSR